MSNIIEENRAVQSSFYQNPTERIFENGSFERIPEVLNRFKPQTIVVVCGGKFFRASPYFGKLQQMLAPYRVIFPQAISKNPTQTFIQEELDRLRDNAFDLIVAIGGGSVLDISKILALLPKQPKIDLEPLIEGRYESLRDPVPLIALPTTSGTGSEVTPYVSLETNEKKKITLGHPFFYPRVAIIDPELTHSMPAYVTASTGFDALSQAIESFWSVRATPFSQTHALRALELIVPNLKKAFLDPTHSIARWSMSLGSCEAGLGIAQTKTTAVHSVSYPITAHFSVVHGHACALTLAAFIRFNAPVVGEKGHPMLRIFGVSDYESMAREIEKMMDDVGLEKSLSKLGIDESGMELILREGFRPDRIKNNPRFVDVDDLRQILKSLI